MLGQKALAACITYVDWNPAGAGIADTPQASDQTSIQARIRAALSGNEALQPALLMPFVGKTKQ
jgi:hypothetical protein